MMRATTQAILLTGSGVLSSSVVVDGLGQLHEEMSDDVGVVVGAVCATTSPMKC